MDDKGPKELVDHGFDSDFSPERIKAFCDIFTPVDVVQEYVYSIHDDDNTLDMKRGEFYPEILRSIASYKRAIANAYDVQPVQCHPNFGCNGCIDTIQIAMKLREVKRNIDPDKEGGMLVATPTYFRNYNSSTSKDIRMLKVPLLMPDWSVNLDTFLEKLKTVHPTVVFLVTPNNPTGIAIPDDIIISIIENAPDDVLVVMDRTLVNITSEVSTKVLINRFPDKQLAIMHSLSKYVGMSHLRSGFTIYSNEELAEEIRPLLPLGLGVEGAIKATLLLNAYGPLMPSEQVINNIKISKRILESYCNEYGRFSCTNFVGNYCLLILPDDISSQQLVNDLEDIGIYIMGGHSFPEPRNDVVRFHMGGKPEYMARTVEALNRLY
ncbi:aminotransferase class I/II-fold pyridoxal phosphate-dependent enzyme [Gemmatimonadota bacterium]